jgi:hypothetical protein
MRLEMNKRIRWVKWITKGRVPTTKDSTPPKKKRGEEKVKKQKYLFLSTEGSVAEDNK